MKDLSINNGNEVEQLKRENQKLKEEILFFIKKYLKLNLNLFLNNCLFSH